MNKYIFKFKSLLGKVSPNERAEHFRNIGILNAGENCEIFEDVNFGSEPYLVKIGNQVRITKGVKFITHDGGLWVLRNLGMSPNGDKMGIIKINNNVFIGINSIIMPDVTIGSNVIIGAGSLVTKDIPSNSVFAGVPAKYKCTIEEFYDKNKNKIDFTKQMNTEEKKDFYTKKFHELLHN
jgi:acetyltransferase-like isoleucine patch superfamily enzyme